MKQLKNGNFDQKILGTADLKSCDQLQYRTCEYIHIERGERRYVPCRAEMGRKSMRFPANWPEIGRREEGERREKKEGEGKKRAC